LRSGSGTATVKKQMSEVDKAAATVMQAMQALDAHRHETAPTLEREYRAALEAYFIVSERAAGRERADGEPIEDIPGWDAEEAFASLEEEARAIDLREGHGSIQGHYAAARRALRLARTYRAEPGSSGRRERECVASALRHREAIHALRLRMQPPAEQLLLPGLAKTRPASVEEQRAVRSA
jgi:hypothetical protein